MDLTDGELKAIDVALDYGQADGARHKAWVIDQMLRALTGSDYDRIISDYCKGPDGYPFAYDWDTGIAP